MAAPTISHVRGCDPQSILTLAADLTSNNDVFAARIQQVNHDVDAAMNSWHGQAAAAAAARSLSQELASTHISQTVVSIVDALNTHGAALVGYRTALLVIVDHEIPAAGMTVDDAGTVTPPQTPTGADSSGRPVVPILVQQGLRGQADGFQSRVKNLLYEFGVSEMQAAQAITKHLPMLDDFQKIPDGPPLQPKIKDIVDGKARLPEDPKQLHDLWETLTPQEKDALWQHDQYLGNRDGVPAADRDHFNRMKLQDELSRAGSGDPAVKDKLGDLKTVAAEVEKPDRYLLQLDTQSGSIPHAAISAGNPDMASHVSTYVPGTSSRPATMNADMVRADAMRQQAQQSGAKNPAIVAWFGYDAPQSLPEAASRSYADRGAAALDRFQDGLRASHEGQPSYNTVVGHSYGTTLVGDAASHGRSLNADAAVFVASPGTTVDHASDLDLTGIPHDQVAKNIYATKADNDPVPLYADTAIGGWLSGRAETDYFGGDPTWDDYGARSFKSDPGQKDWWGYSGHAHSQYWDPNCKSLRNMGFIIAGQGDMAVK